MTIPLNPQPAMPGPAFQGLPLDTACAQAAAFANVIRETESVALAQAVGRCLAQDVVARRACPDRDLSAMDGYAVATACNLGAGTHLKIEGRIAAGDVAESLADGTAARIFTGAAIPAGAGAVVMQEHAKRDGAFVILERPVAMGENIRRRAEDVAPGDLLLREGQRLNARGVAIVAAQGIDRLVVRRPVRVAILSTGNELCHAQGDCVPATGALDSTRPMLLALAAAQGLTAADAGCVPDDPSALADHLRRLAERCDLIVTTGGASVGEEDHSATALRLAGGTGATLKMALKPGKPAIVGRIGAATYLGLPGNPLAALVSWSLLGNAVFARLEGRAVTRQPGCPMPIRLALRRKPGRTEFIPARIHGGPGGLELELLAGNSARLRPLLDADGFVELPETLTEAQPGHRLAFHPFERQFAV